MFVITHDLVNDNGEYIGQKSEDCPKTLNLYSVSNIRRLMYHKFKIVDGVENSMYEGFSSGDSFEDILEILNSVNMSTFTLERYGFRFLFED